VIRTPFHADCHEVYALNFIAPRRVNDPAFMRPSSQLITSVTSPTAK
jgi:hypothetical protein